MDQKEHLTQDHPQRHHISIRRTHGRRVRGRCPVDFKPRREATRHLPRHHSGLTCDSQQNELYFSYYSAIKSKMELYIDGGIKTGSDIFKCLALGADFVFLGRGFLFSVCFGEEGVKNAFDMLTGELKTTMMLCGANSVKSIS
jgi:hypothetical protein